MTSTNRASLNAEFQYSYHHGDSYIPHIQQEEPLKAVCHHFISCIENGTAPLSGGPEGLEMIRILEAASDSLRAKGASVALRPAHQVSAAAVPAV